MARVKKTGGKRPSAKVVERTPTPVPVVKKTKEAIPSEVVELDAKNPGTTTKLEAMVRKLAGKTLASLVTRYPPRACTGPGGCGKKFSVLLYLAERGKLRGKLPSRCRKCSEAAGQPWNTWKNTYAHEKYEQVKNARVSKAARAAAPINRPKKK